MGALAFGAVEAFALGASAGLADEADVLLGAYLATPGEAVVAPVAFGVARPPDGDTADPSGEDALTPDGTWELTPLYAVALGR